MTDDTTCLHFVIHEVLFWQSRRTPIDRYRLRLECAKLYAEYMREPPPPGCNSRSEVVFGEQASEHAQSSWRDEEWKRIDRMASIHASVADHLEAGIDRTPNPWWQNSAVKLAAEKPVPPSGAVK